MSTRTRLGLLIVICVLALGAAGGYLVQSRVRHQKQVRDATPVASAALGTVERQPHIVFQNRALGSHYGMVAEVALKDPRGSRSITTTSCDRVYAAQQKVICLASKRGVVTTYSAQVLSSDMTPLQPLPLSGIPSRARLSADARLASTTTFVAGDSYAGTSFSTRTTVSRVGTSTVDNLESFALIHDGHHIAPVDRNLWGVTFAADDDTFYVTVAWSGHTWLARGSIARRTVTTIHEDAECPSLSPDGTRIVYKQRGNLPVGRWRLVEFDISTGHVTPLAETRSVDDQVAWLNDSTVMYGLPRSGSQGSVDDVWSVPADGSGKPTVLIPQAWSPALVG